MLEQPPSRIIAYIDESGDENLNSTESGRYFSVAAVIVKEQERDSIDQSILAIEAKHFSGGQLKSSKSSLSRPTVRMQILRELFGLDFRVVAFLVDKSRIDQDSGMQFKTVYRKKIAQWLCMEVTKFIDCEIIFDTYGREPFREEFCAFVEERISNSLFSPKPVQMAESKLTPIIRVADVICGTLRKTAENGGDAMYSEMFALIAQRAELHSWPKIFGSQPALSELPDTPGLIDEFEMRVERFLSEHDGSSDEDHRRQVIVLRHLQMNGFLPSGDEVWVPMKTLRFHLEYEGLGVSNDKAFSRQVIGPLRDYGIVISFSDHGYKLASSLEDVLQYFQKTAEQVLPQLKRVLKANEAVGPFLPSGQEAIGIKSFGALRDVAEAFRKADFFQTT
jgi:hypothetical protein